MCPLLLCFFFQAEDGIRDYDVTGVQTCALPIYQRQVQRHDHDLVSGRRETPCKGLVPQAAPAVEVTRPGDEQADAQGSDNVGGLVMGGHVLPDQAIHAQTPRASQAHRFL